MRAIEKVAWNDSVKKRFDDLEDQQKSLRKQL
jgi:hypothetical protein